MIDLPRRSDRFGPVLAGAKVMRYWRLIDGEIVEVDSLDWYQHQVDDVSAIKVTHVVKNSIHVSTVFIGLGWKDDREPPILFETMVFGAPPGFPSGLIRDDNRADAIKHHDDIVNVLKAELGK